MGLFAYSPIFRDVDSPLVTLSQVVVLGLAMVGARYVHKRAKGYRLVQMIAPRERRVVAR